MNSGESSGRPPDRTGSAAERGHSRAGGDVGVVLPDDQTVTLASTVFPMRRHWLSAS